MNNLEKICSATHRSFSAIYEKPQGEGGGADICPPSVRELIEQAIHHFIPLDLVLERSYEYI